MSTKRIFIAAQTGMLTNSQKSILTIINHIDAPEFCEAMQVALAWSFEHPHDLTERDKFTQMTLMSLFVNASKMIKESPVQPLNDN